MQKQHRTRPELIAVYIAMFFLSATVAIAAHAEPNASSEAQDDAQRQTDYIAAPYTPDVQSSESDLTDSHYQTMIASRDWEAEESEILLKIAMAEAEGESTEGKALVMLVVLNRVWSDGFPNTIEDVVFQKIGGSYQFSPVAQGGRYWTTEPNDDCYEALEMVLHGWDESQGALYFEACTGESWQSRNCEYLFTLGGHNFYK